MDENTNLCRMDLKLKTVNKLINKAKSSSGIGLIIILIFVASLFQNAVLAQPRIFPSGGKPDPAAGINPSTLKLDSTLEYKKKAKGLLKKIVQPIKFNSNKLAKEKEGIYTFMLELIQEGQLKIDPTTVKQIMKQLDEIVSANNSNNERLDGDIKTNESASQANEKKIKEVLESFNIQDKANQSVIESIKTRMSAFIQENEVKTSQDKREVLSQIDAEIKDIRDIKYSTASKLAPKDTFTRNDTLFYFRKSLSPKKEVIGWYRPGIDNNYFKYKYQYLSTINLDNYKLSANGKCKNPKDIIEFEKPGGIIGVAQSYGCDVHLTVYNNHADSVENFLRSSTARDTLILRLDSLIKKNKLKGINIYFDCVMKPGPFVSFIAELRQNLKRTNPTVQLNISLPAIINLENNDKIASYDFTELEPLVDYFFVLTDNLIPKNPVYSQAASPLYKSEKISNRSIESTFSYYRNTVIPSSKLILTVSYSGTVWDVSNFSGRLQTQQTRPLKYADIQDYYFNKQTEDQSIAEGFDPDQAAPYLNVFGSDSSLLEQIWFEDARSLYLKYNWALENKLGGISIRGLGNDHNYPELWDALGASLMQIDSVNVENDKSTPRGMARFWKILSNAFTKDEGFKRKTFIQDLQWAGAVRLKYDSPDTITGYRRFDSKNRSIGSVNDTIDDYIVRQIIWKETIPFEKDSTRNNEAYQKSKSYCYSLYSRWTIYANFFIWSSGVFLVFAGLLYLVSIKLERYLIGSKTIRNIFRYLPVLLILFAIIFILFWLYINPSFSSFGAGSEDGANSLLMIYFLIFGIAFGWFCTHNYYRYRGL